MPRPQLRLYPPPTLLHLLPPPVTLTHPGKAGSANQGAWTPRNSSAHSQGGRVAAGSIQAGFPGHQDPGCMAAHTRIRPPPSLELLTPEKQENPGKLYMYTFQSQPSPSSGTMLFQNFRSRRSAPIRAVMAGGNTTSPCIQWQLHKLRGQHQLSQGDPKPRKTSKRL